MKKKRYAEEKRSCFFLNEETIHHLLRQEKKYLQAGQLLKTEISKQNDIIDFKSGAVDKKEQKTKNGKQTKNKTEENKAQEEKF